MSILSSTNSGYNAVKWKSELQFFVKKLLYLSRLHIEYHKDGKPNNNKEVQIFLPKTIEQCRTGGPWKEDWLRYDITWSEDEVIEHYIEHVEKRLIGTDLKPEQSFIPSTIKFKTLWVF
jgi:hypothetical protein